MDPEVIRKKVRCGVCAGPLGRILNLVELERKATWEYPVAGNVITGTDGLAVAVICDRCIKKRANVVEAVEFQGDDVVYHPIEGLERAP